MRAISTKMTRVFPIGAVLNIVDNSGARKAMVIGVKHYKTRTRKLMSAGVADLVMMAVKKGKQDVVGKVVYGIVIRQKKKYPRPSGLHVRFEDNAAVLIKDIKLFQPSGTLIKGPVAKEVAERWPTVVKIANIVL